MEHTLVNCVGSTAGSSWRGQFLDISSLLSLLIACSQPRWVYLNRTHQKLLHQPKCRCFKDKSGQYVLRSFHSDNKTGWKSFRVFSIKCTWKVLSPKSMKSLRFENPKFTLHQIGHSFICEAGLNMLYEIISLLKWHVFPSKCTCCFFSQSGMVYSNLSQCQLATNFIINTLKEPWTFWIPARIQLDKIKTISHFKSTNKSPSLYKVLMLIVYLSSIQLLTFAIPLVLLLTFRDEKLLMCSCHIIKAGGLRSYHLPEEDKWVSPRCVSRLVFNKSIPSREKKKRITQGMYESMIFLLEYGLVPWRVPIQRNVQWFAIPEPINQTNDNSNFTCMYIKIDSLFAKLQRTTNMPSTTKVVLRWSLASKNMQLISPKIEMVSEILSPINVPHNIDGELGLWSWL